MGAWLGAVELASRLRPAYWQALANESRDLAAGDAELRAARRSFGDLPLIVLARTINP